MMVFLEAAAYVFTGGAMFSVMVALLVYSIGKVHEIYVRRHVMQGLIDENRELHRQLDELGK